MNSFSTLAAVVFVITVIFGGYSLYKNHKDRLNIVFSLICLCIALWAFSYIFIYNPKFIAYSALWIKISSIGWCMLFGVGTHYLLIITNLDKKIKNKYLYIFIYLPGIVFFIASLFTPVVTKEYYVYKDYVIARAASDSVWFRLYLVYFFVFITTSLILITTRLIISKRKLLRNQGILIFIFAFIPSIMGFIFNMVLPCIDKYKTPSLAPLFGIFWTLGMWIAVVKYNFLGFSPKIALNEVLSKMSDLLILIDENRNIILTNSKVDDLLESDNRNLIGKPLTDVVLEKDEVGERMDRLLDGSLLFCVLNVNFINKSNEPISAIVSASLLKEETGAPKWIMLIGQDMRQTQILRNEIIERKIVENQAKNYITSIEYIYNKTFELIELSNDVDVFEYLTKSLREISCNSIVISSIYDYKHNLLTLKNIDANEGDLRVIRNTVKTKRIRAVLPNDFELSEKLVKYEGNLHEMTNGRITIEQNDYLYKTLDIGDIYFMKLSRSGRIFGYVIIISKKDCPIRNANIIETFINQVSVELQRRLAEKTLRDSEERYSSLLSQLPEIVIALKDDSIGFINKTCKDIVGYEPNELIGRKIIDFVSPESKEVFLKNSELLNSGKTVKEYEIIFITKSGAEKTFIARSMNSTHENEPEVIMVLIDITERKAFEIELKRAKDASDRANKAKSEFLAIVSHEIRTPINGILGMINVTFLTKLSEEQKNYLEMAKSSAESLLRIINDILDFSKIEAGKLEIDILKFDLNDLIEKTLDEFSYRVYSKNLEIIYKINPDIPKFLYGDPKRIKQILINLINNAIKFTEKGEIVVSLTILNKNENEIDIRIFVKDSGIGIPEEKQKDLFKSFSQIDSSSTRKYGGTGLGLAISKKLIELMKGEIELESLENVGSNFYFTLKFEYNDFDDYDLYDMNKLKIFYYDQNETSRAYFKEIITFYNGSIEYIDDFDNYSQYFESLDKNLHADKIPDVIIVNNIEKPEKLANFLNVVWNKKNLKIPVIFFYKLYKDQNILAKRYENLSHFIKKPIKIKHLIKYVLSIKGDDSSDSKQRLIENGLVEIDNAVLPDRFENKAKILLAEDNMINQQFLTVLFTKKGWNITTASSGKEALEKYQSETFDLILMDVEMSEMDGITATKKIREIEKTTNNKRTPIIALTAYAMKGDRERCIKAGMDDYLSKPIIIDELFKKISIYLEDSTN
ncbi:MAG TPA: response regulator [Spirochaetota bacterium]|nr:response regulator [Spirochaetota bacterium]HPY87859.1 response regulator [Spirochaetota bacterium]HQB61100.1 response regulator [Spirochaetota bacterium]